MLNVHQTLAHAALFYALSDMFLAEPSRDWSGEFLQVAGGYMEQVKAGVDGMYAARKTELPPSVGLAQLVGVYASDLYGEAIVGLDGGRLTFQYGKISSTLEHWQGDTFLAKWNLQGLLEDALIAFQPKNQTLTIIHDRAQFNKIQ